MNSLVKSLIFPLLESEQKGVALIPGGFKPPTIGHFVLVDEVAQNLKLLSDNKNLAIISESIGKQYLVVSDFKKSFDYLDNALKMNLSLFVLECKYFFVPEQ